MKKNEAKDDIELFESFKMGNISAFETLFDRYYIALCNFSYLFLKNKELCEEIISDLFVNLWLKKDQISIQKNFKSFVYRSTYNACISMVRTSKPEFLYDFSKVTTYELLTPETILLNSEFEASIHELLNVLPKVAGLVLRMKKIDGLKYKEIAEILNISEKTVENHIINAIRKLRQEIEKKPELLKYFTP